MLDSKQKRGSAIDITMPHRQWLTEPTGTIGSTPRQSLLKLCSAVAFAGGGALVGLSVFMGGILSSRIVAGKQ